MKTFNTLAPIALILAGFAPVQADTPAYLCDHPFGVSDAQGPAPSETTQSAEAAPPPPVDPVKARYRAALRAAFQAQPKGRSLDRHQLRARLALPRAAEVAPFVFVTFDGTASHEPRLAPALLALRELGPLPRTISLSSLAREELKAAHDIDGRTPTLLFGPLRWLLREPDLVPGGFVWESFPSEAVEALGGVQEALQTLHPERLVRGSRAGTVPRSIRAAQDFLLAKLTLAARRGIAPHVVVLAHSSGGQTAVRFVESLAQRRDPRTGEAGIQVDLVVSFDPVRAAHTTLREVLADGSSGDGQIDSQEDDALYKPANAKRWVSFRQDTDTRAVQLGGVVCYGIQGSPVTGADEEHEVEFSTPTLASSAHVNITHGTSVRRNFFRELRGLRSGGERAAPPAVGREGQARNFLQTYLIEPYRVYKTTPRISNFRETLDFLVALTAGKRRDPQGYRAFQAWLRQSQGDVAALDAAWVGYRRTLLANRGTGSTEGLTRRSLLGRSWYELDGRREGRWKSLVEGRMRRVSAALGRALAPRRATPSAS